MDYNSLIQCTTIFSRLWPRGCRGSGRYFLDYGPEDAGGLDAILYTMAQRMPGVWTLFSRLWPRGCRGSGRYSLEYGPEDAGGLDAMETNTSGES